MILRTQLYSLHLMKSTLQTWIETVQTEKMKNTPPLHDVECIYLLGSTFSSVFASGHFRAFCLNARLTAVNYFGGPSQYLYAQTQTLLEFSFYFNNSHITCCRFPPSPLRACR